MSAHANGTGLPVQSVSVTDGLQKALDNLTDEMCHIRTEMKELYDDNKRLRDCVSDKRGRCSCTCRERGYQVRAPWDGYQGHSPDCETLHYQEDPQGQHPAAGHLRVEAPPPDG